MEHGNAVCPHHLFECQADRFGQPSGRVIVFPNEVGEDFGVGLRRKGMALGDQFILERLVIFDDSVVDERNLP